MGDIRFNSLYLRSTHGIVKILQIVLGFIICSFLCATWYGRSCFSEGRLGYCSGLNFVIVIINIVIFILNIINLNIWSLERVYSIIAAILFLIAAVLIIWFLIEVNNPPGWLIAATVLIIIEFILFLWDVKILQGESANIVH